MSKWGWVETGPGKRTYKKLEEGDVEVNVKSRGIPTSPPGGASCARKLGEAERTALFIQTGCEFNTLKEAEKYGKKHGFRIAEQSDKREIKDTGEYERKVHSEKAGLQMKVAKKLLTRDPARAKHARDGGIHAEQARREGRD